MGEEQQKLYSVYVSLAVEADVGLVRKLNQAVRNLQSLCPTTTSEEIERFRANFRVDELEAIIQFSTILPPDSIKFLVKAYKRRINSFAVRKMVRLGKKINRLTSRFLRDHYIMANFTISERRGLFPTPFLCLGSRALLAEIRNIGPVLSRLSELPVSADLELFEDLLIILIT